MPLMLMSNPGLHLALLGNPRRKPARRVAVTGPRSLSRRTFLAGWRRAKKRVGKRYHTRGRGTYRITRVRVNRDRRHRRHASGVGWSGRRGTFLFSGRVRRAHQRRPRRATFTNPRYPMARRRRSRRNPHIISGYVSAAKAAPRQVMALFTGPNKVKNIAFAAGGAAATYLAGGIVSAKVLTPVLGRIPVVGGMASSPIGKRVIGGLIPFTIGYVASKFVKGDIGKALMVGGAAASLVELVKPGLVGQMLAKIPGAPAVAAAAPAVVVPAVTGPTKGLDGLDGYVSAPSYAGVGGEEDDLAGYVSAPSYAGVGDGDELDGYVSAPSYAGVGDGDELAGADDVMAGVDGYIEQAANYTQSYLAA